ncbi:MAG TPA: hypothetical protein IGS17_12805 [Oscillatoriales cyanobacterium M59_W2019_021]|nr:hypothetical protein [Oscillatoriales cyanobacterium M4454_W2019_049]HIK51783.1 hypothetical protein [Oscillatoriales cyanobacterium M59_W2019_021]
MTIQSFLEADSQTAELSTHIQNTTDSFSSREPVRLMAIGSKEGVLRVIHTLHRLRFAEVSEWSPLLPAPTPGEVMSILTRYFCMNSSKTDETD